MIEQSDYKKERDELAEININTTILLNKTIRDLNRLKILFDSEFCRCGNCGEYKRSGFGCDCGDEE